MKLGAFEGIFISLWKKFFIQFAKIALCPSIMSKLFLPKLEDNLY